MPRWWSCSCYTSHRLMRHEWWVLYNEDRITIPRMTSMSSTANVMATIVDASNIITDLHTCSENARPGEALVTAATLRNLWSSMHRSDWIFGTYAGTTSGTCLMKMYMYFIQVFGPLNQDDQPRGGTSREIFIITSKCTRLHQKNESLDTMSFQAVVCRLALSVTH